jgi:peptide/nickel transport system substrate-binding protein
MSNYPVLVENAEQGGYRVLLWPTFGGSDAVLMLNQTYQNDPAIGDLLRNRDFRIALSHAIDREAIRELAFLGLGEPRQGVPAPNHPYYPGDEYAYKYTEYDPDLANQMLDEIGMTERDAEGFRLGPNGDPIDLEISGVPAFANWPDVAQLVVEHWGQVGVKAHVEVRERALHFQMRDANELQVDLWNEDTTGFPFSGQPKMDPRSSPALSFAPLVRTWYLTNGSEGQEASPEIQEVIDLIDQAKLVGGEEQIMMGQELFKLWVDNLWEVGTVGMTPMVQGVVVANNDLGNVAETAGNDWPLRTPGNTRPEQLFFRQ